MKIIIQLHFLAIVFSIGLGCGEPMQNEEPCPEDLDRESCEAIPGCVSEGVAHYDPDTCERTGVRVGWCLDAEVSGGDLAPGTWARLEGGEWRFYVGDRYVYLHHAAEFIDCLTTAEMWPLGERPEECDLCQDEFGGP